MNLISVTNHMRLHISSVHGSQIDKIHIEAVLKKKKLFKFEIVIRQLARGPEELHL